MLKNSINRKVINYYRDCGKGATVAGSFLWKARAFPSLIYQAKRINETKNELKKIRLGRRILDAPCGSGYLLSHLPSGSVGVDINPRHVSAAKKRAPNAEVIHADMEQLPYKNGEFSAVIVAELFEHIPDPSIIIAECRRVLKKNGLLIVTLPTENPLWKIRFLASSMYKTEPQCVTFSEESMLKLFVDHSFEKRYLKKIALGLNYFLVLEKK